MAKYRIALVFSDTGGGHRSAVDAIDCALREVVRSTGQEHEFDIISDNIVEKTHPVNRAFVDFYNYLLRKNQRMMKFYYAFIQTFKPNDSKAGYAFSGPYLENWLRTHPLDVLVSVHPMVNQYMVKALKNTGLFGKVKLVTVITDPNGEFWRGWACPEADLSIVPNDLGQRQLIEWDVDPDKIRVLGMPVNGDFIKPPSVNPIEFRQSLSLSPDKPTICINAGWAGGGNMLHIYRELKKVKRQVQAIFLCGHNRALYEMAKKEAHESPIPTAVLPFHDRMPDLMAAVDLMVTKAGGLTTFEAIARKLPMAIDVITPPMPQEAGTVEIIIEEGLARPVRKPEDIVEIVEQLKPVMDRSRIVLPSAHSLDKTDAVYEISQLIVQMCHAKNKSQGDHTPTAELL